MLNLYWLTLPGLDVRWDWRAVHDGLLDEFEAIETVLPTTTAATLLIAYRGQAQLDGWLDSIDRSVVARRLSGQSESAIGARSTRRPRNGSWSERVHGSR